MCASIHAYSNKLLPGKFSFRRLVCRHILYRPEHVPDRRLRKWTLAARPYHLQGEFHTKGKDNVLAVRVFSPHNSLHQHRNLSLCLPRKIHRSAAPAVGTQSADAEAAHSNDAYDLVHLHLRQFALLLYRNRDSLRTDGRMLTGHVWLHVGELCLSRQPILVRVN